MRAECDGRARVQSQALKMVQKLGNVRCLVLVRAAEHLVERVDHSERIPAAFDGIDERRNDLMVGG